MGKLRPGDGKGLPRDRQGESQKKNPPLLVPTCQVAFLELLQKDRKGPALRWTASAAQAKQRGVHKAPAGLAV